MSLSPGQDFLGIAAGTPTAGCCGRRAWVKLQRFLRSTYSFLHFGLQPCRRYSSALTFGEAGEPKRWGSGGTGAADVFVAAGDADAEGRGTPWGPDQRGGGGDSCWPPPPVSNRLLPASRGSWELRDGFLSPTAVCVLLTRRVWRMKRSFLSSFYNPLNGGCLFFGFVLVFFSGGFFRKCLALVILVSL